MSRAKPITPPKAAVRGHWVLIAALIVVAGVGYLGFELGRVQGGYSFVDAMAVKRGLTGEIKDLQDANEALTRQIAVLETAREVDREAYAQVEMTLASLQEEIQTQEEEVAFYRGIVAPEDGVTGLKIQALEVTPADAETDSRFRLHLVLVQAAKHDRRVSGVVNLTVAGEADGTLVSYPLEELARGDEFEKLAFSFRYFQDFQADLVLPNNFRPQRVEVELRPSGRGAKTVERVFDWAVTPS